MEVEERKTLSQAGKNTPPSASTVPRPSSDRERVWLSGVMATVWSLPKVPRPASRLCMVFGWPLRAPWCTHPDSKRPASCRTPSEVPVHRICWEHTARKATAALQGTREGFALLSPSPFRHVAVVRACPKRCRRAAKSGAGHEKCHPQAWGSASCIVPVPEQTTSANDGSVVDKVPRRSPQAEAPLRASAGFDYLALSAIGSKGGRSC